MQACLRFANLYMLFSTSTERILRCHIGGRSWCEGATVVIAYRQRGDTAHQRVDGRYRRFDAMFTCANVVTGALILSALKPLLGAVPIALAGVCSTCFCSALIRALALSAALKQHISIIIHRYNHSPMRARNCCCTSRLSAAIAARCCSPYNCCKWCGVSRLGG